MERHFSAGKQLVRLSELQPLQLITARSQLLRRRPQAEIKRKRRACWSLHFRFRKQNHAKINGGSRPSSSTTRLIVSLISDFKRLFDPSFHLPSQIMPIDEVIKG